MFFYIMKVLRVFFFLHFAHCFQVPEINLKKDVNRDSHIEIGRAHV